MHVAELRKMTEHCQFGQILDDMIRDRVVCGVNNDLMIKLLTEPELTYQKAVDIALALESTAKHVQDLGAKNNMLQSIRRLTTGGYPLLHQPQ